jgi:hypothetical protein
VEGVDRCVVVEPPVLMRDRVEPYDAEQAIRLDTGKKIADLAGLPARGATPVSEIRIGASVSLWTASMVGPKSAGKRQPARR